MRYGDGGEVHISSCVYFECGLYICSDGDDYLKLYLSTHMRPPDPPRPQNQTDGPVSLAMENLPQSQSKQQPLWPAKNNSIFAL